MSEKDLEKQFPEEVSFTNQEVSIGKKGTFFDRWQTRHQAYLAGIETAELLDEEEVALPSKKGLVLFAKGKNTFLSDSTLSPEGDTGDEPSKKNREHPPLSIATMLKATSIIACSLLLLFVSLFFISPSSKAKEIKVEGNQVLSAQEVEDLTLVSGKDYALTLALNAKGYAANIKKGNPYIKSAKIQYKLPNRFTIQVEEYQVMAYIESGAGYLKVLSSGEVLDEPVLEDQMPEHFLLLKIDNRKLIQKIVKQLDQVDPSIYRLIEQVDVTPSKVTADLLTLTMVDNHSVVVPLGELENKLPYYKNIIDLVDVPSVIDMEVGIFRYPK